jgi:hypothetical protein
MDQRVNENDSVSMTKRSCSKIGTESGRQGELGTDSVMERFLRSGSHVIIIRATHSDGLTSTAQTTVVTKLAKNTETRRRERRVVMWSDLSRLFSLLRPHLCPPCTLGLGDFAPRRNRQRALARSGANLFPR